MSNAPSMLLFVSSLLAACVPRETAWVHNGEGVPTVYVGVNAWSEIARARAALDFRCQPTQVQVALVGKLQGIIIEELYLAQGCARAARYACHFQGETIGVCVREPLDDIDPGSKPNPR